jgi:hypothetical protein
MAIDKNYRNKKILSHAKGQSCTCCGTDDGTVVAAHSNLGADGKGVGLKAADCFVAYLCFRCHTAYDHKIHNESGLIVSQEDFHRAMKRTWAILLKDGTLK